MLEKFLNFVSRTFSEQDGTPSSSRILTFISGICSIATICRILLYLLVSNPAPQILEMWLSHITSIVGSLIGFTVVPYLINKGSGALEDAAKFFSALHKE